MKRNTILAIALFSLCFLSPGLVAKNQTEEKPPPKAEEIKFIAATPEQQKKAPPGMVYVPAGDFMMGNKRVTTEEFDIEDNEKPYHKVYLDGYYIDKYEVTVIQYMKCVQAQKCKSPYDTEESNHRISGRENHPVNYVDWEHSEAYCRWAGKRLPAEAEWEKAARGTDGREFPWGDQEASCDYAIMDISNDNPGCGKDSTWPVGSRPKGASPYGALDMAGNVNEWTADWYDKNYYKSSPSRNPTGPSSGQERAVRGGSWNLYIGFQTTYYRSGNHPKFLAFMLGFRCARTP